MVLAQLLCLGRHTISNLLCTAGRQMQDWSADYRLFSLDRWDPREIFRVIMNHAARRLPQDSPLVLAMDDTQIRKTGTHVPGASFRRDPMSPAFHCNLIRAQRFLQASLVVHSSGGPGPGRCVPVAYEHAPSVPRPRKNDSPEQWKAYRSHVRQDNLSTRGRDLIRRLRAQMDADPLTAGRRLVVGVDGSYSNRTVLRGLPERTVVIGRVRGDMKLFAPPDGPGRRRYGQRLPTPEQLREDASVPWKELHAYAAGAMHVFHVKTMDLALWKNIGWGSPVKVMAIRPLRYRLQAGSRLLYRKPAYLMCLDPDMPDAKMLQDFVWRWGVEVNHRDEKQIVGVGEAQVTNEASAERQPALAVASYSLMLLASCDAFGMEATAGSLPPPKWRAGKGCRLSTQQMVQELRCEAWAPVLGQEQGEGTGAFVKTDGPDTKPPIPCADPRPAVLYGSVA